MQINFHVAIDLDYYDVYDPIRLNGSFLSDIDRACNLTDKDTHHCGRRLKRFFKKNNPKYIPAAVAIKVHRKIDYLAEKNYNGSKVGYVLQDSWKTLAKIFGESIHYIPELWIDSWITRKRPELSEIVLASIEEIDINEFSSLLGKFFRKKEPEMEEVFPRYLDWIISYEKTMSIKKYLGVAYNAMNHRNHEQFYSDVLGIVRKKYLKELHMAYKYDKRAIKRITGRSVLSSRQSRPSL